jgi:hypothetical protein
MPQPFLDYPPSESSPRRDRAPLSGPLAPLQLSTVLWKRASDDLITRRFTDSHALDAVAKFPCELWTSFPRVRRPASQSPWVTNDGIAPSTSFTCSEALFPLRVRSHCPEQARA